MVRRHLKTTALLLSALFTSSVFVGCGSNDKASGSAGANGDDKKEQVTITYGGWEGELMMNELIEKFEELNPHINVEISHTGWMGNEKLSELAATGDMPDIINIENPVIPVQNDWVIDMKPYVDKDEESKKLYSNFVKYGTVNDKLIMLPSAVFLHGVMVNKDLLAANNIEIPGYDWTVDEYVNIVKKTTKKGTSIGTNGVTDIMKHIPAQMNDDLGWGAFNESTLQYNLGEEWQKSVGIASDLYNAKVSLYEHIDDIGNPWDLPENSAERTDVEAKRAEYVKEAVGEEDAGAAFLKGKAAVWQDFTWAMGLDSNPEFTGFEWDFYPFPVVEKGDVSRPGIVVDSVAITTACEYPEEAFEFIKFITYSKQGHEARIDIVKNYDKDALQTKYPDMAETNFASPLAYNQMPAIDDQEVIDQWVELNNGKPGIAYMMSNMGTGYADGFKVTPGYVDAYENTIVKTVKEQVYTGKKTAADLANELETKANDITKKAYDVLNK